MEPNSNSLLPNDITNNKPEERKINSQDGDKESNSQSKTATSWQEIVVGSDTEILLDKKYCEEFINDKTDFHKKNSHMTPILLDSENAKLLDKVRPIKWIDPKPSGKHDILIIGAGAGGLVTASRCSSLGATVGLIERNLLGGDCLNTGCVPSKAFIKCANEVHKIKHSYDFGIKVNGPIEVDFPQIMKRMRGLREHIAENDSAERFSKSLGVNLYLGEAKFISESKVEVNGQAIEFEKCCIATGGRPSIPQITGVNEIPYYTSDTIWNITKQPKRVIVIGCGPVGCEMGQAFQRLGSEVTMISTSTRVLPREDETASEILQEVMKADGVSLQFESKVNSFKLLKQKETQSEYPEIEVVFHTKDGEAQAIKGNLILFATGREPNVEGLNLESAGVEYDKHKGIAIDDTLKTSNKNIFAIGDAVSEFKFTHWSDAMARLVTTNALLGENKKLSSLFLPWCTYTEPEVAHVGKRMWELDKMNTEYDTYTKLYSRLDRALLEGNHVGYMKIHTVKNGDGILGATIVGHNAGDLISQITTAMVNDIGLSKMGEGIFPYPTYAEGFKHMADAFNRNQLPFMIKKLFRKFK